MPAISKIRLTNVVYEEGHKRYNDELFLFDGHNGGILLENGGGKTVLIQTALQAILPHVDLADRKIKNTLSLENAPAHIAIEWIDHDQPRRYVVTAVTLFLTKNGLDSLRYVYEYDAGDANDIEGIPFVRETEEGKRPAERVEMQDYYQGMKDKSSFFARTFATIKDYKTFIEEQYHIIASEWESIVKINATEGGVDAFFDDCKRTNQLFDRLLIPTVEDSIVGHDKTLFADMFEKQHQSFKNYKKLKETIEENKRIQAKLTDYVGTFERLHQKQETYLMSKQQAKGVWQLTLQQKQHASAELADVSQMERDWEADDHAYRIQSASYDIALEKAALAEQETIYYEHYTKQLDQQEARDFNQKQFSSLKLAQHKLQWQDEQEAYTHAQTKLANLNEDEELSDLQDVLDETNRALLGNYLQEIEGITDDKKALTYELNPILNHIKQLKKSQTDMTDAIDEAKQEQAAIWATIAARERDMHKIKQQILANPQQEHVATELKKWETRSQTLDEEMVNFEQQVRQLNGDIQEAEEQKNQLIETKSDIAKKENEVAFQLRDLHEAERHVISVLATLRPQWARIDDIYSTQNMIETRIHEQIEKRKKERTNLLYKERLAYRFVDDYHDQDVFFSDPFLANQLVTWKNQLDYLATGVEYLQNLDETERHKRKDFPLWPLTLITTTKSKQQLLDKLRTSSDRLQFPIIVMTTEEALHIDNVDDEERAWIAPQHWHHNLGTEKFSHWKQQMAEEAELTTINREQKETDLTNWEDGLKAFQQFLATYPYELASRLNSEQTEWKKRLEEITLQIKTETKNIADRRSLVDAHQHKIKVNTEEMQGLQPKIERGHDYLTYVKEVEDNQEKEQHLSTRLQRLEKDRSENENALQAYYEDESALQQRINDLEAKRQVIKREADYVKVESLEPLYTGESRQTIKAKLQDVNRQIDRITVTQGEWVAKQDAAITMMHHLEEQMADIRQGTPDVDEEQTFPSDGEHWMESLREKILVLNDERKTIDQNAQQAMRQMESRRGRYENKLEQFAQTFPDVEPTAFEQTLAEVADRLQAEETKLRERKAFIDQQSEQFKAQLDQLTETERELERHIESHHFNAPDLQAIELTEAQKLDFNYQRHAYVKTTITEMKNAKQAVDDETEQVEKSKARVRDFCRKEISDVKLQQMAINGIEHKHTYHDVIAFKNNMFTSIDRISKYANEHIRQSDEDLQLFINQIHTHLKNMVTELKQIPNKTKVKVQDDWKQIFTFTIPEWEDEVGKTRIRDHIEWILLQLESDRFINEQGLQDQGKVRKDVEMWLQTKSLLQVVMNNETAKVSCRKVTNDNRVTSRSYSWEQSNVWSGGEKWSKNMTLFLGILNYVAEKKQHLQSDMKRHRAVILDNPFGKASSDHVLSPVFFVAEQLGFQIIALTAHAEGKFLQDYFPVIYSCRLRASQDTNKKVMTKEKWLHHAYFRDHQPQELDRLGEVEQMELF